MSVFTGRFRFHTDLSPKAPFLSFSNDQQPPEVRPDPVQVELSKRLDRIERRLDRIKTHQREDNAEIHRRLDALNGRIYWIIGTQIALMGLLFAALKLP